VKRCKKGEHNETHNDRACRNDTKRHFKLGVQAKPAVEVIARGAAIKGANGLFFDNRDRLHIGSVLGEKSL